MVTREDAQKVVDDHVKNDSLKKHLFAVETCMRAFARKEGGDEETWGIAGLVHDFDWEICPTPESHPTFGADILRERGFRRRSSRPSCPTATTPVPCLFQYCLRESIALPSTPTQSRLNKAPDPGHVGNASDAQNKGRLPVGDTFLACRFAHLLVGARHDLGKLGVHLVLLQWAW